VNYHSTAVQMIDKQVLISGELTIRDVTMPVPLVLEVNEFETTVAAVPAATFVASAQISRRAFGIRIPGECAGLLIGDKVSIRAHLRATLRDHHE